MAEHGNDDVVVVNGIVQLATEGGVAPVQWNVRGG